MPGTAVGKIMLGALAGAFLTSCSYGERSFEEFNSSHPAAKILPVEFVEQQEAVDCGAAVMTSVGRFWGLDVPEGKIFNEWAPSNLETGYTIAELKVVSDRLGLASSRLLEEPDYAFGLVDKGAPVIAALNKPYQYRSPFDWTLTAMLSRLVVSIWVDEPFVNHYVAVLGSDEKFVYILDPQDGYRAIERDDFIRLWRNLTEHFVPGSGESVAAFVPYRAPAPKRTVPAAAEFKNEAPTPLTASAAKALDAQIREAGGQATYCLNRIALAKARSGDEWFARLTEGERQVCGELVSAVPRSH